jgi:hypothetical protein
MLQAFVGIVSREGLEVLCPEHPETIRFLSRRARRETGRVACIWSVIPEEAAAVIDAAVRQARFAEALMLMLQQAREYGSLLPPEADEAVLFDLHG